MSWNFIWTLDSVKLNKGWTSNKLWIIWIKLRNFTWKVDGNLIEIFKNPFSNFIIKQNQFLMNQTINPNFNSMFSNLLKPSSAKSKKNMIYERPPKKSIKFDVKAFFRHFSVITKIVFKLLLLLFSWSFFLSRKNHFVQKLKHIVGFSVKVPTIISSFFRLNPNRRAVPGTKIRKHRKYHSRAAIKLERCMQVADVLIDFLRDRLGNYYADIVRRE